MKKRLISLMLVAAMVASALVGCGSGNSAAPAPAENQAVAEAGSEAAEGEAAAPTEAAGEAVMYSNGGPSEFFETPWLNPGTYMYNKVLYSRMLMADENMEAMGGDLADSYELAADGSTLTMTLKEGVTWTDGEALTLEDVQWSIEYSLLTTVLNSVFRNTFMAIEGAEAFVNGEAEHISGIAVDGNTITLNFASIAPDPLLCFTQFAILPMHLLAETDPISLQQDKYFQSPVGSGTYKIEDCQMGNYTILAPNENYYDGTANFKIHLTPSAGDSDGNFVTNAKAGKMDYGYTKSIDDVLALEGTEGLNIETVNVRYTRLFYLNKFPRQDGSESPLADVKVRQAIRYAIDMAAICEGLMNGSALPANSLTPDGADKKPGLNDYSYDPEKAKALLAEAGWDANTELKVVYYYTDQATQDLMAAIQQYLAMVGVKMNASLVEGDLATILWSAPEDPVNGPSAVDWDICYAANAAMSLHEYYDRYQTGYAINSHTPSDATLDELIAATNATLDPEAVKNAFFDLQQYENDTLFCMPLYYQPIFLVYNTNKIDGIGAIGNPQYNYNWGITEWTLK